MIPIRTLLGLGRIPNDRSSATSWLRRNSVSILVGHANGGEFHGVECASLPELERRAYLSSVLVELDITPGTYDDAAHEAFLQAPASMRARAERNAAIALELKALGPETSWPDRLQIIQEKFGVKGTSKPTLKRLLAALNGVDPINYAPALLPSYKGKTVSLEISQDAWRFFVTTLRNAAPEFPLKQAWRDVRDAGAKLGWAKASYSTYYRRWQALSDVERHAIRYGNKETIKKFSIPVHRDKTSINALEWVSLDGRTQDFWVDYGNGQAVRPVMLALIDVATNKVLEWELAPSENAAGTVRLIKRTCETYGIFDRLYTDNGSAFAGHLVAGGNVHKFRNGGKKAEGVQPPGICKTMGIELKFALPGNAQAKIAERTFASLSRVIDDRPEFRGCHAGHAPGASPSAKVKPIPVEQALAVIRREVERHNCEPNRRSQGADGRSYQQMFQDGIVSRIKRKPTARQLYLSGLIYSPVSVDRVGQIRKSGWVYGDYSTQEQLLPYHGKGQRILLGRDPEDFSAPAIAFDETGHRICEGIEPVKRGKYGSADGIREAARNKKAARNAVAKVEAAQDFMNDAEFATALAALDTPTAPKATQPEHVVAPRFGSPLKDKPKPPVTAAVPEEFLRNMDAAVAKKRAQNGKLA